MGGAVILSTAILMVMVLGDALVYSWPKWIPTQLWALLDSPVHLVLALLVVAPLFAHPAIARHLWIWLAVAAMAAVFVDFDHFIAARSFALEDALELGGRPIAHSLTFTVAMAALTWIISREPLGAILVLGVLLSHIVRDASHGTAPLWWPLPGSVTVPIPLYYAIEIGLGLTALWILEQSVQTTWLSWIGSYVGR
jgi:hypothetical protein